MRQDKENVVDDKGKCRWSNVKGWGVQLLPASGNRGGYPLLVVLDGRDEPVRIDGPEDERVQAFQESVEIQNGVPGDRWRLYRGTEPGFLRRHAHRTDSQGRGIVRAAGGAELAHVDMGNPASIPATGTARATYFLRPGLPSFVPRTESASGGEIFSRKLLWDLRDMPRVRFAYQANGPLVLNGNRAVELRFFLDCFTWSNPVQTENIDQPFLTLPFGTANQFGQAGSDTRSTAPARGWVELGAAADAGGDFFLRSAHRFNWARLRMELKLPAAGGPPFDYWAGDVGPTPVYSLASPHFTVEAF